MEPAEALQDHSPPGVHRAAEEQPGQRSDVGQDDDDQEPHALGQVADQRVVSGDDVEDAEDPQGQQRDGNDAQIEKQSVLVKDPEGRKKILQDIQRYLINNAQVIYLVGTMPPSLRWPYLKDYFFAQNMEETYPRLWLDK